jgi:hypothetical protein
MKHRILFATLFTASMALAQTVSIQGAVYTLWGQPIEGATCQFKNAGNKATTNAQGKYDFSAVAIRKVTGYSVAMASQGRQLTLKLDRDERVSLDVFNLSGKLVRAVANGSMSAGSHSLPFTAPSGAQQLYLLRVKMGSETAWHKLTIQDGMTTLATNASESSAQTALLKTAATDSLFCTAPGYSGGMAKTNGRNINAYTGTQDFRMFSLDPAWGAQCSSMPITFNFDNTTGAARYKELLPNYVDTQKRVMEEVCQSVFKIPSQARKYPKFTANIQGDDGVANTAGGNTLNFATTYIAKQPNNYAGWAEVVGVQIHEGAHTFQPYYAATGADGFGEAMPDAVRALTGYFIWGKGTKCGSGSTIYQDPYQSGGKLWYYIEMKHPGFLTSIWQIKTGDISARVKAASGEELSALLSQCQTTGMP